MKLLMLLVKPNNLTKHKMYKKIYYLDHIEML